MKTSFLSMDERLPALYLELLDTGRETVELVMFFLEISCHRLENSYLFCSSSNFGLLDCLDYLERFACAFRSYAVVVETKGQIERASYCRQALEKPLRSFSLILLTLKWSLNSLTKRFLSWVCSNSTLFFNIFFCLMMRGHTRKNVALSMVRNQITCLTKWTNGLF